MNEESEISSAEDKNNVTSYILGLGVFLVALLTYIETKDVILTVFIGIPLGAVFMGGLAKHPLISIFFTAIFFAIFYSGEYSFESMSDMSPGGSTKDVLYVGLCCATVLANFLPEDLNKIKIYFKEQFNFKLFVIYPALFTAFLAVGTYLNGEDSAAIATAVFIGYPTTFLALLLYVMVSRLIKLGVASFWWASKPLDDVKKEMNELSKLMGKDPQSQQRQTFEKMTIPELKQHLKSKGVSKRLPPLKAGLVKTALGLWIVEQSSESGEQVEK